MPLPTLGTDRLVLRAWRPGDQDAALEIYSRWEVARYLGAEPRVMADLAEATDRVARWAAVDGPVLGVWAVVPDDGERPVGAVMTKVLPLSGSSEPSGEVEIGWHLHPDVWGRGYATEAAARLLRHCWEHGLDAVHAVTYPQNAASQAVCRRLGMTALGPTDRYYGVPCELFRVTRPPA